MLSIIGNVISEYASGRQLVVYGTGESAELRYQVIERTSPIAFYISNDAYKVSPFHGKPVYLPQDIMNGKITPDKYYIIILARGCHTEIRQNLNAGLFKPLNDYLDWNVGYGISHTLIYKGVSIGKSSYFGLDYHMLENHVKQIGAFCSINGSVKIECNHPMNTLSTGNITDYFSFDDFQQYNAFGDSTKQNSTGTAKVTIGNDVWIGANVFINTSRVSTIGDGAVIGAGAIVTQDIPPYAIVTGVPARVQRYRFSEKQIECLLRVKWWNWDNEDILENAKLLTYPELFFEKFQ